MKTKYSLGVCNLADLVYTVLLIRVLCFQRDGGLGGKGGGGNWEERGDWEVRGGGSGGKGGEFFLPLLHPDFAPAMHASSVLSHCLSQTRNSCTINSDTLSFSSRCLNEYQPHMSWVLCEGQELHPSKTW